MDVVIQAGMCGQGYDTVLGAARSMAVRAGHERSLQDSTAAAELYYKVCDSVQEVRSVLQIDQLSILRLFSAAGSHLSDEKLAFFEKLSLTTNSVAIVVYLKVRSGGHTITDATFSVAVPKNMKEMEDFQRVYGDSYVATLVTGAEYYASFVYRAATQGEKMEMLARMKEAGLHSWGLGNPSIDNKIAKFNSSCNVCSEFCQVLRGISGVGLPRPTQLLDFVLKVPTLTIDKPQVLHFETVAYKHVLGFQFPGLCTLKSASNIRAGDFLLHLLQVKALENDVQVLEAMLRRSRMWKGPAQSYLNEVKAALKTDRGAVQDIMHQYENVGLAQCILTIPTLKTPEYEERIRSSHWMEVESSYLGGPGGDARDYVKNVNAFMRSNRRIVAIRLCSGSCIDAITIWYDNNDTCKWGGWGGNQSNVLHVPEDEHFAKICVRHDGNFVTYLQFLLTNGNSITGGDCKKGGHETVYEPYENCHYFCGFQARSGGVIDGLRAIFAIFKI